MSLTNTTPKKFCFVLMPFNDSFNDIYKLGIKQSCEDVGAYCERVDEQIYSERILDRIYNQISKADIIIADMSEKNPNVFYEVGYAHALGKTCILLTNNAEDIPFDFRHFPHIIYKNSIYDLKEKLTKKLEFMLKQDLTINSNFNFDFKLSFQNSDLLNIQSNLTYDNIPYNSKKYYEIRIFNNSQNIYYKSDYKIGLIFSDGIFINEEKNNQFIHNEKIEIEKNLYLLYIKNKADIFPFSYSIFEFGIGNEIEETNQNIEVIVRFFTKHENRDFYLNFKS